ncbi:glycine betaine ABC transporter substrate-binding protein [Jeotgalibacillus salarius]|uniref:Glycine/betaine ABC transporter substrate-binding protein n=1 Tax=Jeotgalibacillus salarius TaxID=546023 RepID=A0A4Y8LKJ3_9BACL|nr:glycine betaine ABC transporter substrate-binding protein [Jeotgalibacillus salarius]TFE02929.1 glycine/betaine ABC transporter substrate-binding protein [Jeotgalibacillus salarius]
MKHTKKIAGASIIAMSGILAACGGESGSGEGNDPIIVAGKPWTEQYILPHILELYIEANSDYEVELEEGLGEVAILTPSLENGDIDMYVEYTGTGLEAVLNEKAEQGESSDSVLERVRSGYEEQFEVTWLEPLGFENGYTMAYRSGEGIEASTYSELAEMSSELVFGAPHSFYEREADGYDALVEAYDFEFTTAESFDPSIMYDAVRTGEVDVIPAFTTDGRIERFELETTEDDKGFFPKYDAVPLVRQEVLDNYPELEEVMGGLAGQISEEEMQEMNAKADIDGEDYRTIAEEFLTSKGLIEE